MRNRIWQLLLIAGVLSVIAGTGLTYAKQGWVTRPEVEAARFIRDETPGNAVFLGQGSTRVMIRYYGEKVFVKPPETVFLAEGTQGLEAYLAGEESSYQEALSDLRDRQQLVAYKLQEIAQEITRPETTKEQGKNYFEALQNLHRENDDRLFDYQRLKTFYPTLEGPMYLVYVKDKFRSLYGTRSWWRLSNFYGAELEKFNVAYPVVYSQNGVTIWKVRD